MGSGKTALVEFVAMYGVFRYEEEHFVRLQHKRRREDGRGVANDMNQLLNFSDIRALTDDQPSSTMVLILA